MEDKIDRVDRELAREAVMFYQLHTCIEDFIQSANLSNTETHDWANLQAVDTTIETRRILQLHSPDFSQALSAAEGLTLEEFRAEVEDRGKHSSEQSYTMLEKLGSDFYQYMATPSDEKDDELLLKGLFADLVHAWRD
jgi:hypothetical protein